MHIFTRGKKQKKRAIMSARSIELLYIFEDLYSTAI